MADDNLPGDAPGPVATSDAPRSFDETVEDISSLLSDPESPDPTPEDEEEQAADADAAADEDAEFPDAEDVEDKDDADEPDGSEEPEIKGGRFAPDSAKVTLDDGSVITVADLKRNNLFQRDYTKKTTELSERSKALESKAAEVDQFAQSLSQFREYAAWYAENHMPKEPGDPPDPNVDPHGYQVWTYEKDRYQQHLQAYQAFQQTKLQDSERQTGETRKQHKERMERETAALERAYPFLKDPSKRKQFWDQTAQGAAEHYGITEQEVQSVGDHRMVKVLRDALAYRRLKASAPSVKDDLKKRPVAAGARRGDPKAAAQRERQARAEQLRSSGNFDDGVALIKNLIS